MSALSSGTYTENLRAVGSLAVSLQQSFLELQQYLSQLLVAVSDAQDTLRASGTCCKNAENLLQGFQMLLTQSGLDAGRQKWTLSEQSNDGQAKQASDRIAGCHADVEQQLTTCGEHVDKLMSVVGKHLLVANFSPSRAVQKPSTPVRDADTPPLSQTPDSFLASTAADSILASASSPRDYSDDVAVVKAALLEGGNSSLGLDMQELSQRSIHEHSSELSTADVSDEIAACDHSAAGIAPPGRVVCSPESLQHQSRDPANSADPHSTVETSQPSQYNSMYAEHTSMASEQVEAASAAASNNDVRSSDAAQMNVDEMNGRTDESSASDTSQVQSPADLSAESRSTTQSAQPSIVCDRDSPTSQPTADTHDSDTVSSLAQQKQQQQLLQPVADPERDAGSDNNTMMFFDLPGSSAPVRRKPRLSSECITRPSRSQMKQQQQNQQPQKGAASSKTSSPPREGATSTTSPPLTRRSPPTPKKSPQPPKKSPPTSKRSPPTPSRDIQRQSSEERRSSLRSRQDAASRQGTASPRTSSPSGKQLSRKGQSTSRSSLSGASATAGSSSSSSSSDSGGTTSVSPAAVTGRVTDTTPVSSDTRHLVAVKEGGLSLGLRISGGRGYGVFVDFVTLGSLADTCGLKVGDRIQTFAERDFADITHSAAGHSMLGLSGEVRISVKYSIKEYESLPKGRDTQDNFFIRCHINRPSEAKKTIQDLGMAPGDIFLVTETAPRAHDDRWKVNQVAMATGVVKDKHGFILSRKKAADMLYPGTAQVDGEGGAPTLYEPVSLLKCEQPRPVVLLGAPQAVTALRTHLLKEYDKVFCTCPVYDVIGNVDMSDRPDVLLLTNIHDSSRQTYVYRTSVGQAAEKGLHCLLDVSPRDVVTMLSSKQYPIVILLLKNKSVVSAKEEFGLSWLHTGNVTLSNVARRDGQAVLRIVQDQQKNVVWAPHDTPLSEFNS
ncbi:disks large homolog 5-like [Sycon ciliatum]|uniref:disks large homolog 5-like n=1 Tax=Sycon ciliatum TaxID=27933 RepID=UPI0031F6AEF5